MNTPTPQQVLEIFAELTGIRFRVVSDILLRQAAEFAKHFTFAELEAVILWTKRQEKDGKVSFNAQSVGWRKLMGEFGATDPFLVFQERLGMAETDWKAKRFRYAPRFKGNERITAEVPAARPVKPTQDEAEQERIRQANAEAFKNFKL
jgi:hypothetical protein